MDANPVAKISCFEKVRLGPGEFVRENGLSVFVTNYNRWGSFLFGRETESSSMICLYKRLNRISVTIEQLDLIPDVKA